MTVETACMAVYYKVSGLQADILFSSMTVFYSVVSFASLFCDCPARVRLNTRSKHVQKIQIPAPTSLMLSEIDFLYEAFCIFYVLNFSITSSCHCKPLRCIACVVIRTAF